MTARSCRRASVRLEQKRDGDHERFEAVAVAVVADDTLANPVAPQPLDRLDVLAALRRPGGCLVVMPSQVVQPCDR